MFTCILFIISTGAGFVTQPCKSPDGYITNPQQVVFVSNGIPAGHLVYSAPKNYTKQWNSQDYQGTEYSYRVSTPNVVAHSYRSNVIDLIDTTIFLVRSGSIYSRDKRVKRRHRRAHSRTFRTGNRRTTTIKKRRSRASSPKRRSRARSSIRQRR